MYRDMLLERLHDARKRGYGVLSFNFNDCWDIQAVVAAAEELNAPIMVESVGYVVDSISLELCAAIGQGADDLKRCRACGKPFQARSNRALYCPRCAAFEQRKKTRERVRRHRGQM